MLRFLSSMSIGVPGSQPSTPETYEKAFLSEIVQHQTRGILKGLHIGIQNEYFCLKFATLYNKEVWKMKRTKLYNFYMFGYNYNNLLTKSVTDTSKEFLGRIDEYFEFITTLGLSVTQSGIRLKKFSLDHKKLQKLAISNETKNKKIPGGLHSSIVIKLKQLDSILDAELNTKIGYVLEEKRFSNEYLTEGIDKLFAKGVFDVLPVIGKYDFRECGLCLAFDRFTAAAFHSLRGTEDVLKLYYSKLFSLTPKETDTWGDFLKEIGKAIHAGSLTPEPPEELMINLDNLRRYYRNQTQHPRLTYTADDAQDLLALCTKSVNEIIRDLRKRKLI